MQVNLSNLNPGDSARVAGYSEDSPYAQKLLRLGLIPGTSVRVKRRAPLGDPIEIGFRGFSLSLRPVEACCLLLDFNGPPAFGVDSAVDRPTEASSLPRGERPPTPPKP